MKRIYKYPTGAEVPDGAIYLGTVTNGDIGNVKGHTPDTGWKYVWHYFLVECDE